MTKWMWTWMLLMIGSGGLAQTPTQLLRGGLNYSDHAAFNGYFLLSIAKPTVINTCTSPVQIMPGPNIRIAVTDSVLAPTTVVPTSCLKPSLPYYVQLFDSTNTLIYTDNWYIPRSLDGNTYIGTLTSVNYAAGITVSLPQAIVGTPVGAQTITQPAGTSLTINNATITNLTANGLGGSGSSLTMSGFLKAGTFLQFGSGGLLNGSGATILPSGVLGRVGSLSPYVQMSNGSLVAGHCLMVGTDLGTADAGAPCGGGGGGSVSSVALSLGMPWLTLTGSPITSSGTISVTATSGQPALQVLATPTGGVGPLGVRALVAADLPAALAPTSINSKTYYTNLEFCPNGGTFPSCTACTTAATIDPANGSKQRLILTAASTCALTFTQPAAKSATVQVTVIQSSSGGFNGLISGCTWPGGAGGGVAPVITPSSGAVDTFTVYLDSATARCQIAQAFN